MHTRRTALIALSLASVGLSPARAATTSSVIRHNVPTFPIAASIEVPPGYATIYLSGMGADVADPSAPKMSLAAYGNTETQVRSALAKISTALAALHLGLGDVVQMHVYLVADSKLGKLDFAGMMKGYTASFGTHDQPNLPTRSAVQVAALANPGWLVEIEVVAVRKP